ncbi:BTAD domain-containing putative transcriptional regulator [Thermopolyspora sp. NPDC052614]|uniref:AfsR/SARP family transcriptional regulator n=1 Tax=Thermopolyspora sp. NPDC052614 TaxID=3155682 RepID=UPI003421919F
MSGSIAGFPPSAAAAEPHCVRASYPDRRVHEMSGYCPAPMGSVREGLVPDLLGLLRRARRPHRSLTGNEPWLGWRKRYPATGHESHPEAHPEAHPEWHRGSRRHRHPPRQPDAEPVRPGHGGGRINDEPGELPGRAPVMPPGKTAGKLSGRTSARTPAISPPKGAEHRAGIPHAARPAGRERSTPGTYGEPPTWHRRTTPETGHLTAPGGETGRPPASGVENDRDLPSGVAADGTAPSNRHVSGRRSGGAAAMRDTTVSQSAAADAEATEPSDTPSAKPRHRVWTIHRIGAADEGLATLRFGVTLVLGLVITAGTLLLIRITRVIPVTPGGARRGRRHPTALLRFSPCAGRRWRRRPRASDTITAADADPPPEPPDGDSGERPEAAADARGHHTPADGGTVTDLDTVTGDGTPTGPGGDARGGAHSGEGAGSGTGRGTGRGTGSGAGVGSGSGRRTDGAPDSATGTGSATDAGATGADAVACGVTTADLPGALLGTAAGTFLGESRETPIACLVTPKAARLLIRLLGGVVIEGPGGRVDCTKGKDLPDLLGLLAVHRDGLTREKAHELLWPDVALSDYDRFHSRKKEVRKRLRRALADGVRETALIRQVSHRYFLNADLIDVDYWRLTEALSAAAAADGLRERLTVLRRAVDLYTGPFLPGVTRPWSVPIAENLRRSVVRALTTLIEHEHDATRLIALLDRTLDLDPCNEPLRRRQMRLHADLGRVDEAHRSYRRLVAALDELGGLRPSPLTTALYRDLTGPAARPADRDRP